MRSIRGVLVASALVTGCTHEPHSPAPIADTYHFGPFDIEPSEEVSDDCIQISLNNEEELYINRVELTTGPGFHHSNWFFVRENTFMGPDGTWKCDDRFYSEPAAALSGGVLFAQSTQAAHETQKFPPGAALKIPPYSKLVAQIHLLNTTDAKLHLEPYVTIEPIPKESVTKLMAGVSFENQALLIHAHKRGAFTLDCNLAPKHNEILGRDPDFKLYYGLAHYHHLGTSLTVEAIKPDGTATPVFDRGGNDLLGGPIDPLFDFTGYSRLRFTCNFDNTGGDRDVRWGIGDQEMCVFLAFSDSPYQWGGGHTSRDTPTNVGVTSEGVEMFEDHCDVFGIDASR